MPRFDHARALLQRLRTSLSRRAAPPYEEAAPHLMESRSGALPPSEAVAPGPLQGGLGAPPPYVNPPSYEEASPYLVAEGSGNTVPMTAEQLRERLEAFGHSTTPDRENELEPPYERQPSAQLTFTFRTPAQVPPREDDIAASTRANGAVSGSARPYGSRVRQFARDVEYYNDVALAIDAQIDNIQKEKIREFSDNYTRIGVIEAINKFKNDILQKEGGSGRMEKSLERMDSQQLHDKIYKDGEIHTAFQAARKTITEIQHGAYEGLDAFNDINRINKQKIIYRYEAATDKSYAARMAVESIADNHDFLMALRVHDRRRVETERGHEADRQSPSGTPAGRPSPPSALARNAETSRPRNDRNRDLSAGR